MFVRDRPIISDSNFVPVVQIISWLLLGFTILSIVTRLLTKFAMSRKLSNDDLFAFIALLLAVAETVCILLSTDFGLGTAIQTISARNLDKALRAQYAAELLFIIGLWATKISILLFLAIITPVKWHRYSLWATAVVISIWAITAVFSTAFQCSQPDPWEYIHGRCIDRLASAQYIGVFNILTEAALIVIPTVIIMQLKTTLYRRIAMVSCFVARLLFSCAIVAQIVESTRVMASADPTLDVWPYLICLQFSQASSLITACIPYLKPFLESLQAGALRPDDAMIRLYGSANASSTRSKATRRAYVEIGRESKTRGNRTGTTFDGESNVPVGNGCVGTREQR